MVIVVVVLRPAVSYLPNRQSKWSGAWSIGFVLLAYSAVYRPSFISTCVRIMFLWVKRKESRSY